MKFTSQFALAAIMMSVLAGHASVPDGLPERPARNISREVSETEWPISHYRLKTANIYTLIEAADETFICDIQRAHAKYDLEKLLHINENLSILKNMNALVKPADQDIFTGLRLTGRGIYDRVAMEHIADHARKSSDFKSLTDDNRKLDIIGVEEMYQEKMSARIDNLIKESGFQTLSVARGLGYGPDVRFALSPDVTSRIDLDFFNSRFFMELSMVVPDEIYEKIDRVLIESREGKRFADELAYLSEDEKALYWLRGVARVVIQEDGAYIYNQNAMYPGYVPLKKVLKAKCRER